MSKLSGLARAEMEDGIYFDVPINNDFYCHIEEPIRDHVRRLRNDGWNTFCSCGHKMTVDIELPSLDEVERLARSIQDWWNEPFWVDAEILGCNEGIWIRRCTVHFGRSHP